MRRSTLITPREIREFVEACRGWGASRGTYARSWEPFLEAEPHLTEWITAWIQRLLSESPEFATLAAQQETSALLRGAILDFFLAGVWFGERRWAARRLDVLDDVWEDRHGES